jgi:hypothetical protein
MRKSSKTSRRKATHTNNQNVGRETGIILPQLVARQQTSEEDGKEATT